MTRKTKPTKGRQRARGFSSRASRSRLRSPAKVSSRKTLKAIYTEMPRWTISELARYLNVPKSDVFRLVKTFEQSIFSAVSQKFAETRHGHEFGSDEAFRIHR